MAEWQDGSLIGGGHHGDSENGGHGIILSAETSLGRWDRFALKDLIQQN